TCPVCNGRGIALQIYERSIIGQSVAKGFIIAQIYDAAGSRESRKDHDWKIAIATNKGRSSRKRSWGPSQRSRPGCGHLRREREKGAWKNLRLRSAESRWPRWQGRRG